MATKYELQQRLEALEKIRASGVLRLRQGDTETTFRSQSELEDAIKAIEGQLARIDSTATPRVRTIRFHTNEGW